MVDNGLILMYVVRLERGWEMLRIVEKMFKKVENTRKYSNMVDRN
jgi:hypothetical protein